MYYNLYKEEQAKEYILVNHNWSRYGTAVFSVKLARTQLYNRVPSSR